METQKTWASRMLIQLGKRADGSEVLRCVRDDGSITWQKQDRHAAFFVHHDLTHFAVETTLGYRRGFYGLIEEGWDIEETTGRGARGPLPAEALEVENLVGMLDRERSSGASWSAEDFNRFAMMPGASTKLGELDAEAHPSAQWAPRRLSESDLARVRSLRGELFARWLDIKPGKALELRFAVSELLKNSHGGHR